MKRLALWLCLAVPGLAVAEPGAVLQGRVADSSGSALPGVTVEARGPAVRAVGTDPAGNYLFQALPAGLYEISFRLPSFVGLVRRGVSLQDGRETRLDVTLELAVTADVVVTAKKTFRNLAEVADAGESLLGVASSAAQGTVSGRQLDSRPVLRPGEMLEAVPGLVISQHSGEGKANQYYLRGFNLDHGTDFATSVAGIPANMPSHGHGQGYSDLNFVIPELVSGVRYEKGPYAADQGDFSTAGSADISYVNALEKGIVRVGGGKNGYARALIAQSPKFLAGNLLWAIELSRNNGPWVHPENTRKYNGVLRYSQRSEENAFSVTAMGYQNRWDSTDQVPARAIASGSISRFGAVDPTDGGETHRYSLSAEWQRNGVDTMTRATVYALDYRLKLFSNFTYYLEDPIRGDQFEQADRRVVAGLKASQQWLGSWLGRESQTTVGIQVRNDNVSENGLSHTRAREVLETVRLDHVVQTSGSLYFENSLHWSDKVRTVVGLRGDTYQFHVRGDDAANSGDEHRTLLSPKLSIVLGPWAGTELYVNAGYGFHSNDARGVTIREDPRTHEPADRVTPLVRAGGMEVGLRSVLVPRLQTTLSVWGLDLGSELVFTGDAGTTEASRPSRRTGVEIANYWSPLPSLVFDADFAWSRARFRDFDPAGNRIPGAVEVVASGGVSFDDVSRLTGSLRVRYFGPRSLIEDDSVRSKSSTIVNAQVGYEISRGVRLAVDVFNVLNARVSDIDYFYASRLPDEPAGGVNGIHTHPAEPRTARLSVLYSF